MENTQDSQVSRILETINQKSKKMEDELVITIVKELEDAVSDIKGPLNRAKDGVVKAREGLDKSRSAMETFETRVSETLNKFETIFENFESELASSTNEKLTNLEGELAVTVKNVLGIVEEMKAANEKVQRIFEVQSIFAQEVKDFSTKVVNPKINALLEKTTAIDGNVAQNIEQISELNKVLLYNKDALTDLQVKFEQSINENEVLKNKLKMSMYFLAGFSVVNLGFITVVLLKILK